jgi:kynurenine formamidase
LFMKFRTLVIGYSFALALFLFAQHRPDAGQASGFHTVVDLTRSFDLAASHYRISRAASPSAFVPVSVLQTDSRRGATAQETHSATHIIAPAQAVPGLWNVDQIPAERLVAPLVVLDVTAQEHDRSDSQISVEDIARWEHRNGEIPLGSVVIARAGGNSKVRDMSVFSRDAALFLVEGRKVLGLGSDGPSRVHPVPAESYALSHSVYELADVANLDRVPDHGAVVIVAPMKVEGTSSAPARIMALVR